MSYTYLGRNADGDYDYKVTLNIFRDTKQSTVDFDDEIELGVHLNNNTLQLHRPFPISLIFRRKVEPPGSIDCPYYMDQVGIEQGFYEAVISLPPYSGGYHLTFVRCCRNNQDNLTSQGGQPFQGQTYYCYIPNPLIENSSPFFSGVPSPYMCAKDTNVFLNRAIDPDGDSLVYKFVWPFQGGSPTQGGAMPTPPPNLELPIDTVVYNPGYGYTRPFGPGTFIDIDRRNGLTTLYAPSPGSYVVAVEVWEYRNGTLLSKVRLDLQILVLDCPPNKQPKVDVPSGYQFEVEAGQQICFNVEGFDLDNDLLNISGEGDIFTGKNGWVGPTATLDPVSAPGNVSTQFCWTPSCDQARNEPYEFTVIVEDNGCPPKNDKKNVEIIVKKFVGADSIDGPDRVCAGANEVYAYEAKDTTGGSTFYWEVTQGEITGPDNGPEVFINWNGTGTTGTIRMVEISQYGCPGDTVDKQISLLPSPPPPPISGEDTVCLLETNEQYNVPITTGSSWEWLVQGGVITQDNNNQIEVTWNTLGDHYVAAIEQSSNGCKSDTSFFYVNVRKPDPLITGPFSVCPNSSAILYSTNANNGSVYDWSVNGGVIVTGNTSSSIAVDWGGVGTGNVSVIETDRFGCVSDQKTLNVDIEYNLKGQTPIGDDKVCDNEGALPYFVYEANGSVYDWDVQNGSQLSGDSSANITVDWPSAGNGRVGVRERAFDPINNRVCQSPFIYLDVEIFPSPTADILTGNFEMCEGPDSFDYTLSGFVGSTYEWRINGSTFNIPGQGTNSIRLAWPVAGNYVIEVIESTLDSCIGNLVDSTVVVHPNPTTQGIFGDAVLCYPNHTGQGYSVQGFANSTYEWFWQGGNSSGSTTDSITLDWDDNGAALLRVFETTEYGCTQDTLELPVVISRMELDMLVTSVGFPDDRIHGNFELIYEDLKTGKYEIQRRRFSSGGPWQSVLFEDFTSFTEKGLNTDDNIWEYRIRAVDLCGNEHFSEIHAPVNLLGSQSEQDFDIMLNFSDYIGWVNGAQRYELWVRNNNDGSLEYDQDVDPSGTIFIDGNSESFVRCFRIKAIEDGGAFTESWSNEICFYFSPNLYVPNAFTPNNDQLNETFNPVTVAIKDYRITIYNRWGEEVFLSEDKEIDWDGTFRGKDAPQGVYMYYIEYSDFTDERYRMSGTVHLMR